MHDVKKDFSLLKQKLNGKRVVYLDSTATALKPNGIIKALNEYYTEYTANVFRGIYKTSERATAAYESAREKVAKFINAESPEEVIFVRNTTEAINLVAYSWGRLNIEEGDEIVTTIMEHHSNFVPWQALCRENAAVLKIIDINKKGHLNLNIKSEKVKGQKSKIKSATGKLKVSKVINSDTKLLVITHVSNVLGTINPIKEIVKGVKKVNPECLVLVDGAQAVPHMRVDVQDLGCDFYAFSGHKMLGPTGIGVLWAKRKLLDEMAPFNFGGEMIREVHMDRTKYKETPHKFEGGTPHIAGAIGLGAAVDYLESVGMGEIREYEEKLVEYALGKLGRISPAPRVVQGSEIEVYGPRNPVNRGGVVAFNVLGRDGKIVHPHDVAQVLDEDNVFIRAGHHCAQPLHERLGIPASARASFYLYNTEEDVDMLVKGIEKVIKKFR